MRSIASLLFSLVILTAAPAANAPVSFVQASAGATSGAASTFSLTLSSNTVAGDVLLVGLDFATSASFASITDSQGNTFVQAGGELTSPGGARSRVYYAPNIKGGADTITIRLNTNSSFIEAYAAEYSGADPSSPIDAQAGATGSANGVSSGAVTTLVANDLIFAYCAGDSSCTAGSGFAARSNFHNNLIEDMPAGAPGSYSASANADAGWTIQMVAIRPLVIGDTTPPTTPTATAISPSQITVSWTASTDNIGVAGYRILRNGIEIARPSATTYTDSGLSGGTQYSYTVSAFDAAGDQSGAAGPATATTAAGLAQPTYPVKLSSDQRYLVDQTGRPFYIHGEAAWSLISQVNDEDARYYLNDRAAKGFNSIIVNLIEHKYANRAPANINGDLPFSGTAFQSSQLEPYFAHADFVIQQAALRGITVLLFPSYVGFNCDDEGWCSEMQAATDAQMFAWGQYVGNRYKSFPNIIWVIGGDADPNSFTNLRSRLNQVALGIASADPVHTLYTAHNNRAESAMDIWQGAPWLTLNDVYTSDFDVAFNCSTNAQRTGALPVFMVEDFYEGPPHNLTLLGIRTQDYQSVLWGCSAGRFNGNRVIWGFNCPDPTWCSTIPWKTQLDTPGTVYAVNLARLLQSREFWLMQGDFSNAVMTAGQRANSFSTQAVTSRTSDGQTIMAYIPTQRAVTMDLRKMSGASATAWWYNPQTGDATLIGNFPTTGSQNFTPPDQNDWVLVIDDAAANLPAPGSVRLGGTVNSVPAITSLSPTAVAAGSAAFALTVNGTSFMNGSVVNWNGAARSTTFVSGTLLQAPITAADIATAGAAAVTVFNPSPGGGTSAASNFTITASNPVPAIVSLSPNAVAAGSSDFTLTVNGTGFANGSVVNWNGTARTTTFVSATQLQAAIAAGDVVAAGTASVTVFSPAPGGGTSAVASFSINPPNPVPSIASLSPNSAVAGGAAFTLTVNGTGFVSGSVVNWNGAARTTTFVSATQLQAAITAADIAAVGSASVTVFNPAPGGGTSAAASFTITQNPVPAITSLSPNSAVAGGAAFSLTVNGTGFVSGSVVNWNGATRATTFVSTTQLQTAIAAADIAAGGTASVTVFNPAPGGGTSAGASFTIAAPTPTIRLAQVTAKQAGSSASSLAISLPSTTTAGNLIVIGFDYDTSAAFQSITDSQGNTFTQAGSELTSPGGARSRFYYAKSIQGGADTITIKLAARSSFIEAYLAEYAGADPANPIDAQAGAAGSSSAVSSGGVVTTAPGDKIVGYCVGDNACNLGAGFNARNTLNHNLLEDMTAGGPGSYAATGNANSGWTMQMVAIKKPQ
jgi:hypothetical protein